MNDQELRAVWTAYWADYYEERPRPVRDVATGYPVTRGIEVSYEELLDRGMSHETFRTEPDRVIGAGVDTFGDLVDDRDIEGAWEGAFDTMIPHVRDLPDGFKSFDYSNFMEYLNQLVQVEVTLTAAPERKSDLMKAAFECVHGHVTHIHQPGRRRREIDRCPECGESVFLEERKSLFSEIQTARGSGDGFSDVPIVIGGRRWKRERIEEGDEFRINGIPRADFTEDSTHGSAYLDVLYLESTTAELF